MRDRARNGIVNSNIIACNTDRHLFSFGTPRARHALAERLVRLSGGSRVYFANSGAEAIESAIKLARLTGRTRIVALEASFHGYKIA